MADYYDGLKRRLADGLDGREMKWLAERVPWHYNQVQGWVSGTVKPPAEFLARYLGVLTWISPAWLLLEEGQMHRTPASRKEQGYDAVQKVVAAFAELDRVPVVDISWYEPEPRPEANGNGNGAD